MGNFIFVVIGFLIGIIFMSTLFIVVFKERNFGTFKVDCTDPDKDIIVLEWEKHPESIKHYGYIIMDVDDRYIAPKKAHEA